MYKSQSTSNIQAFTLFREVFKYVTNELVYNTDTVDYPLLLLLLNSLIFYNATH